jgi:recombination protein RecA
MNDNKQKALESAIKAIKKQFGEGSIMKLNSNNTISNVEVSSSGILSLDIALGVGGYPRGRIIEIFGPESGGKTTLALHAIAEAQKNGGIAAFVDAEHALDPKYAQNLGVDLSNLLISQPDNGEQALEIVDTLIRSNAVDLIVVDSVAALVPKAELAGDMGDAVMGLQARLMSQALRKLAGVINKTKTIVLFINQLRMKIGGYGNPETTTGGMALKFYSTIRLTIRRGEIIKDGGESVGSAINIKVVKNKVAPPFKQVSTMLIYNKGIRKSTDLLEIAVDNDVITKRGSWYSYNSPSFGEISLGQGKMAASNYLETNPAVLDEVEFILRAINKISIPTELKNNVDIMKINPYLKSQFKIDYSEVYGEKIEETDGKKRSKTKETK